MTEVDSSGSVDAAAVARRIVSAWRRLTGGGTRRDDERRTLVACSGGCDSVALASILAEVAPGAIVVGHVVHDLRDRGVCLLDRDAAADVARRFGCVFDEREIRVAALAGNDEANARSARYGALAEMAAANRCSSVVTAHHAEDQLETCLLALIRGAGPRGLAGMAASRPLGDGVSLIRPALSVRKADLAGVAVAGGLAWREDATNADTSRDRARLRALVVPELFAMRPGLADRLAAQGDACRGAADAIDQLADGFLECAARGDGSAFTWTREQVRACEPMLLGAALRRGVSRLAAGAGMDRLAQREIRRAVDAARAGSGESKSLILSGCCLTLTKDRARLALREINRSQTMAEYDGRTVHLVGHCGPDTFMLTNAIRRALPGVEIASANSTGDVTAALATSSLLLVNRILDGGFENESGIGLIRALAGGDDGPAIMLISNFDDAQQEAEAAGAMPGFGKSDMGSPEANAKLVAAMVKVSA